MNNRIAGPRRKKNSERETPRTDEWVAKLRRCVIGRGSRAELARHLSNGDESKYPGARTLIAKVLDQNQRPNLEFVLNCEEWLRFQSDT
jgi:hypothetical protein